MIVALKQETAAAEAQTEAGRFGPGSLVFTSLLWPKITAASEKARDFPEAREREGFLPPGAVFLGSPELF